jgi:hypothetical protein
MSETSLIGAAILAAVVLAVLMVLRWHPASAPVMMAVERDAAATVRQDFLSLPKPVATIAFVKPPAPPPSPAPAYKVPRADPTPEPDDNVCSRHGGRRVTFVRHHHEGWRCVYPRRRR